MEKSFFLVEENKFFSLAQNLGRRFSVKTRQKRYGRHFGFSLLTVLNEGNENFSPNFFIFVLFLNALMYIFF